MKDGLKIISPKVFGVGMVLIAVNARSGQSEYCPSSCKEQIAPQEATEPVALHREIQKTLRPWRELFPMGKLRQSGNGVLSW